MSCSQSSVWQWFSRSRSQLPILSQPRKVLNRKLVTPRQPGDIVRTAALIAPILIPAMTVVPSTIGITPSRLTTVTATPIVTPQVLAIAVRAKITAILVVVILPVLTIAVEVVITGGVAVNISRWIPCLAVRIYKIV